VIGHAGKTWALVEAGSPPVELTDELDTLGVNPFFGTLADRAFTAHPKVDPDTGDLHAVCYHWPDWRSSAVRARRQKRSRGADRKHSGTRHDDVHDVSLTPNYVVVYDLPVTINLEMAMAGSNFPFAWNNDYQPRVGLLPRNGEAKDIIWVEVGACYVFHPMNAFEDAEGCVVIDVCRYQRMFERDHTGPSATRSRRSIAGTINPRTRRASEQRIDDRAQEFPRFNPSRSSKSYRFGYSVAVVGNGFPSILKHDLQTGCPHRSSSVRDATARTVLRRARWRDRRRRRLPHDVRVR